MKIDIATLFPEMCEMVVTTSIIGRAQKNNIVEIACHNIRDYTQDKHRRVDDAPYGGGKGMVMQAEPIYQCYQQVTKDYVDKPYVIYMSPQGNVLTQQKAIDLSTQKNLFILCGHYEGVDQRIIDEIVDEEISIGDYVVTGGELPAMILVDAVARLLDGVLSDKECFEEESHFHGLLEHPQYTRPEIWNNKPVPEILLSGHHANIDKWRREQSLLKTHQQRKDLISRADLTSEEHLFLLDVDQERDEVQR